MSHAYNVLIIITDSDKSARTQTIFISNYISNGVLCLSEISAALH